jgi:hypothetical protein
MSPRREISSPRTPLRRLCLPGPDDHVCGLTRNYFISLVAPAGTVTTESNAAYKGAAAAAPSSPAEAASAGNAGDWPSYNRTLTSERYSPLSQINTKNVGKLKVLCTYDVWRDYVQLRLPWTLCIRDRVPPGFVAVLINRAYTYPDLALPIDSEQERVFAAIDGNRSIDEILRVTAGAGDERARRFIEQLWEYDQIVFDATRVFDHAASRPLRA